MNNALILFIKEVIRFEPDITPFIAMAIRAFIIYFLGFFIVKINKKFMGVRTPFNFILFIMLGSIAAQSIIGEGPFLPIVCTIILLTLLNWFMAYLAFHFPNIEHFLKEIPPKILIKDGKLQWQTMKKYYITKAELLNAVQTQLHTKDFSDIKTAFLANDGTINFITKK